MCYTNFHILLSGDHDFSLILGFLRCILVFLFLSYLYVNKVILGIKTLIFLVEDAFFSQPSIQ